MKIGKFILAALAYAVVATIMATVYHEMLMKYYNGFNIYSGLDNVNIPVAATGSLIEGAVLTYMVQRFAPATGRISFGILMGVMLCLFASSYGVFQTAALENVQGAGRGMFIPLEFIAMMLYGVVGGAVVGLIYRKS